MSSQIRPLLKKKKKNEKKTHTIFEPFIVYLYRKNSQYPLLAFCDKVDLMFFIVLNFSELLLENLFPDEKNQKEDSVIFFCFFFLSKSVIILT